MTVGLHVSLNVQRDALDGSISQNTLTRHTWLTSGFSPAHQATKETKNQVFPQQERDNYSAKHSFLMLMYMHMCLIVINWVHLCTVHHETPLKCQESIGFEESLHPSSERSALQVYECPHASDRSFL